MMKPLSFFFTLMGCTRKSHTFYKQVLFLFCKYVGETFWLMGLRNHILCIISVWLFICSVKDYVSLYFLPVLSENWFFLFLCYPYFLFVLRFKFDVVSKDFITFSLLISDKFAVIIISIIIFEICDFVLKS